MSPVSQTPARRPMGFTARFALGMGPVAVLIWLSVGRFWRPMLEMVARARPHSPDAAVFASLSPAIRIHLFAALAALALGGVLLLGRKGRLFHRVAGWTWVSLVAVTAGSTLFITSLNHGRWSLLHLLTAWVFLVLPLGVIWAKRHDVVRHRRTMMGLFYGGFAINLFIAFLPGRALWQMFFG